MIRAFAAHRIRNQVELEGLWDFMPVSRKNERPRTYRYRLPVPGCWETHPEFRAYKGYGIYRRTVTVGADGPVRFVFKGVSHTADVLLDGKEIAYHYNAYTPFDAVVPHVRAGEHELMVVVDNTYGPHSALHVPNDYYSYGGITRPVAVEEVAPVFIERMHTVTELKNGTWYAAAEVVVRNVSGTTVNGQVVLDIDGRAITIDGGTFKKGVTVLHADVPCPGVVPWRPGEPRLYLLHAFLYRDDDESPCDDLVERIGFRTVAVKGAKLLVNNDPVFIKGFNRHEDHPDYGCALPYRAMVRDLQLMRDMGANAVRTCHYPNDELFLDLCDETGMLVWEENHARAIREQGMATKEFDVQCADCNREMVENHANHPGIVMWGILNECASHTAVGKKQYAKQFAQIRKLDATRPVTFASCHYFDDKCFGMVDICSINIYPGWYQMEAPVEFYKRCKRSMDASGGKGKPVIISEFGAGAIYGHRSTARVKWSEERQQDIIEADIRDFRKRKEIMGLFIWQFADCRVDEEEWALKRPRTMNNKGIVDEYRRPKLAYDTVKRLFASL